MRMLDKML